MADRDADGVRGALHGVDWRPVAIAVLLLSLSALTGLLAQPEGRRWGYLLLAGIVAPALLMEAAVRRRWRRMPWAAITVIAGIGVAFVIRWEPYPIWALLLFAAALLVHRVREETPVRGTAPREHP
jgi:uncharacterized membrane protein